MYTHICIYVYMCIMYIYIYTYVCVLEKGRSTGSVRRACTAIPNCAPNCETENLDSLHIGDYKRQPDFNSDTLKTS